MKDIDVTKCHWQVILNPNALSGKCCRHWQRIASELDLHGVKHTVHFADHANAGKMITQNLCQQGERYFIVMGGDGTLNEVVNGVAFSGIDIAETYLVPFPVGTGNDWARTHNYPKNYLDMLPLFLNGVFFKHDIGLVETLQHDEVVDQRYFINIAGFCFDAAVIYETTKGKTKLFPAATYIFALLKVLFTYKSRFTRILFNDCVYRDPIFTIAVGIGKYNGNGMMQVPMANPTDGIFNIAIIRKISILKVIASVGKLFKGKHVDLEEFFVISKDECWISSEFLTRGEVEGEMLTTGNYHLKCIKQAINVLKA